MVFCLLVLLLGLRSLRLLLHDSLHVRRNCVLRLDALLQDAKALLQIRDAREGRIIHLRREDVAVRQPDEGVQLLREVERSGGLLHLRRGRGGDCHLLRLLLLLLDLLLLLLLRRSLGSLLGPCGGRGGRPRRRHDPPHGVVLLLRPLPAHHVRLLRYAPADESVPVTLPLHPPLLLLLGAGRAEVVRLRVLRALGLQQDLALEAPRRKSGVLVEPVLRRDNAPPSVTPLVRFHQRQPSRKGWAVSDVHGRRGRYDLLGRLPLLGGGPQKRDNCRLLLGGGILHHGEEGRRSQHLSGDCIARRGHCGGGSHCRLLDAEAGCGYRTVTTTSC